MAEEAARVPAQPDLTTALGIRDRAMFEALGFQQRIRGGHHIFT